MPPISRVAAALAALVLAAVRAPAADLRALDDAPLYAVQLVDRQEGWAAGGDGVVWHTIDGGKHWERQPTGTRAALRAVCFLNPYTGWAVGREELPHGGGSAGVILFTDDGGLKWTRVSGTPLPGLHRVRFFDGRTGVVAGDGSDQHPSGLFATTDGGRTWHPAPGPRCPAWLAADFQDPQTGVLAGAWGKMAAVRDGVFGPADVDKLGGRGVASVQVQGRRAVAAGQGGLVLRSKDSAGVRWGFADLGLPPEAAAGCDFDAVALAGDHIWVAGRPGSVVFHSPDFGDHWEALPTGQPLPIHALQFLDDQTGWAVGEFGTVLCTADGGRTWTAQRRGGQRAAVLLIHARPEGEPLESVAALGADDGYLTAAVRVTAADPTTADPRQAADPFRWAAAQRRAGGAAGDCLATFPLPQHLRDADRNDLLAVWDRTAAGGAAPQLVRQLALQLRVWQPEVVITDFAGAPPETLVVEAVRAAFDRAADLGAFPDQVKLLHLEPWRAKKLYTVWDGPGTAPVVLQSAEPRRRLGDTPRDYATPAAALLTDRPDDLPARRAFRLLASTLPGAETHADLMTGIALAPGGTARRSPPADEADAEQIAETDRALRDRRNLQALSQPDWGKLTDSGALLAQIGPALAKLPPEQGAVAAYTVASRYAQAGQWHLAREAFLLMVDHYPAHPLAADAYRWLVRFHGSSEARRREELGQFLVLTTSDIHQAANAPTRDDPVRAGITADTRGLAETSLQQQLALLSDQAGARRWYQGALAVEPRLNALGAIQADDPAVQFCLQAARRQLGDVDAPRQWYRHFLAQPRGPAGKPGDDPWRDAAAAELWLSERTGPPPKPVATCRQTATRPFLDGNLDDACWADAQPLVLRDAAGDTAAGNATRAWLAYDAEYLYVAVQCQHPAGQAAPPVAKRTRDADLSRFDRVGILLDLDRDYQTCFHLQIDQRGAVAEDCWGDRTWNPRWFVASKSGPDGWTAEAAIPLRELTGDAPTVGKAWACNVVRVLPGRGVQAWSLPADVRPRPEGQGLLLFTGDPKVKP
jgi:photosystem II stability/assembly factor-like uncharacterized protein